MSNPHQSCTYSSLILLESAVHIFVLSRPTPLFHLQTSSKPENFAQTSHVPGDCKRYEPGSPQSESQSCRTPRNIAALPSALKKMLKCSPIHPVLINMKLEYIPKSEV